MDTRSIPATSGIYCIKCTSTGRFYIGSAINLYSRWIKHRSLLRQKRHHNAKLQSAWNKYGEDDFVFDILELVLVREMLTAREQYYFDTLKPFGKRGFNFAIVAGSRLGTKQPPEALEKLRAINLGRKFPPEFGEGISRRQLGRKLSPSTRKKIGDVQRGIPRPERRGVKHSPEHIEKRRRALTGYKHTEEAKRNMGNAHKGKRRSDATKEKMRLAATGHPVSDETRAKIGEKSTGRVFSPEARAKMSVVGSTRQRTTEEYASRRKILILTSPDGTEHIVHGIHEFCQDHGLDSSAIAKVARGKYAHHRGWLARFPETPSD